MRDYQQELTKRVEFIRRQLANAGASGIVYGNSGGKDSACLLYTSMACSRRRSAACCFWGRASMFTRA